MSRDDPRSEPAPPIWSRPAPGERKPAHTRERIAATALALADTEGFAAVSMRRVAAELGAGTMTLYHYVRTKDELIALMSDAIMGEMVIPEAEVPEGWRAAMEQIARRTRAIFVRHPWVAEHFGDGEPAPGPNTLRHIEQSLAVASRTGLEMVEQLELTALVDDFVIGHVLRSRPASGDEADATLAYLQTQLGTGAYPHLERFAGDDPAAAFARVAGMAADDGRFERGLQRLFDGVELELGRRGLT